MYLMDISVLFQCNFHSFISVVKRCKPGYRLVKGKCIRSKYIVLQSCYRMLSAEWIIHIVVLTFICDLRIANCRNTWFAALLFSSDCKCLSHLVSYKLILNSTFIKASLLELYLPVAHFSVVPVQFSFIIH